MDVAKHDEVWHTSHLPHLMAFNLVEQTVKILVIFFRYAAGGFVTFHGAASDPQMWHDIFFANKIAILNAVMASRNNLPYLEN